MHIASLRKENVAKIEAECTTGSLQQVHGCTMAHALTTVPIATPSHDLLIATPSHDLPEDIEAECTAGSLQQAHGCTMAHALTTVAIDAQDYISLQKARLHSFTALSELENIKTKLLNIDWYYRSYRSTITGQVWGAETDINLWNWMFHIDCTNASNRM